MADDAQLRVLETALKLIAEHLNRMDPSFRPDVKRQLDEQIRAILNDAAQADIEKAFAIDLLNKVHRLLNP